MSEKNFNNLSLKERAEILNKSPYDLTEENVGKTFEIDGYNFTIDKIKRLGDSVICFEYITGV